MCVRLSVFARIYPTSHQIRFDVKSFNSEMGGMQPRTNRYPQNVWSPWYPLSGAPQVPGNKLIHSSFSQGGKYYLEKNPTPWEQVINFKPPTRYKRQLGRRMPGTICVCVSVIYSVDADTEPITFIFGLIPLGWFGLVLWHINHSWLFYTKFCFYINVKYMICKLIL